MEHFSFKVQGSAKDIYDVKIWHENGKFNYGSCTCPASASGGLICKHILSVLTGDLENIINPNKDDIANAMSLIKTPRFFLLYDKLKKLIIFENYYFLLKDTTSYINGHFNNDLSDILKKLEDKIIIKFRQEKNFMEESFSYLEKSYLDFYSSKDLKYLFSTYPEILEDKEFKKIFKKNKFKKGKNLKNTLFYTNDEEVEKNLATYNSVKKEISDIKRELREIIEMLEYLE